MTLRIMLLGLVAGMGIELPSGQDVSRWSRSGRDWVAARLVEPSVTFSGAELALEGSTDRHQAVEVAGTDEDRGFLAASDEMVAGFKADLLATRPELDEAAPASDLASTAIGLPEGEELALVAAPPAEDASIGESAALVEPGDSAIEEGESSLRTDRLSAAVRLTREAVQAWADLVQEPTEAAESTR